MKLLAIIILSIWLIFFLVGVGSALYKRWTTQTPEEILQSEPTGAGSEIKEHRPSYFRRTE